MGFSLRNLVEDFTHHYTDPTVPRQPVQQHQPQPSVFQNVANLFHPAENFVANHVSPSVATPINNVLTPAENFARPVYNFGKALTQGAYHLGTVPIEDARAASALLTHNADAQDAALNRIHQGTDFVTGLLRAPNIMAVQLGESLIPQGEDVYNRQYTAPNSALRFLIGNNPIPSFQNQFKQDQAQNGTAYAAGDAALNTVLDVLGGKGALKAPKAAASVATDTAAAASPLLDYAKTATENVKEAAPNLTPLNEGGYTPNPFSPKNEGVDKQLANISGQMKKSNDTPLNSSLGNAADNLITASEKDNYKPGTMPVSDILKQEAGRYKSADEFVSNVHKKIENPANGKSFTALAKEYNLPAKDQAVLAKVEAEKRKVVTSKADMMKHLNTQGAKPLNTYPDAANRIGLGKEYERITNKISAESTKRYKNPYGDTGILSDTFTPQKLTEVYNQAHAAKGSSLPPELQAIAKEAQKYKTPEEFKNAYNDAFKKAVPVGKGEDYIGGKGYKFGDTNINLKIESALGDLGKKLGTEKTWQLLKGEKRPNDALQTKIEKAHNAGNTAAEKQLLSKLNDQGMNPNAKPTPKRRADLMNIVDKARKDIKPLNDKGAIQIAEKPPKKPPVKTESPTPKIPEKDIRGTIKTVTKETNNSVSPQVQKALKENPGTPITRSPHAIIRDAATKEIGKSLNKATEKSLSLLTGRKSGDLSDAEQMFIIKTAQELDRRNNHEAVNQIYTLLSEHRTKNAQALAVGLELSRRSPDGIRYQAQKVLAKSGVKLNDKQQAKFEALMNDVKNTKVGTDERDIATQKLVDFTNDKIPRTKTEAIVGLWRAGLLTGLETVAKISTSHLITTPAELAVRPFAAMTDQAVAGMPDSFRKFLNRNNKNAPIGKRTITFSPLDYGRNIKGNFEGGGAALEHLKTGVDLPHTGGFEKELGKGQHQTIYEKMVFRVHGSIYKTFFRGAYRIEEANQRRLAKATFGDDQKKIDAYMSDPKTIGTMDDYARQFAMQNSTEAGKITQGIQHIKMGSLPVGMWVAPFSRIPAALGVKGIVDYTPVGTLRAAKSLYDGIAKGKFDQRKFSESLSKSAIGGTSMVVAGALLSRDNRLTLQAPTDPKERALWEAEGKQKNAIKIGNKWVSLNAMGAVGIALGVGGALHDASASGQSGKEAALTALASGAKLLGDQPYFKGVTGVGNVFNNPKQYATSYVNSSVGSFIPAFIQQVARGTDKEARAFPKTLKDELKSALPGARESLPAEHNIYGTPVRGQAAESGKVAGVFNPFYPSTEQNKNDKVTQELQRLYDTLGGKSPAITPTKTFSIGKQQISLNVKQQQDMLSATGGLIHDKLNQLVDMPGYQKLDDDAKTAEINKAINGIQNPYVADHFKNGQDLTAGQKKLVTNAQAAQAKTKAGVSSTDSAAVQQFKLSADKVKQIGDQTYYRTSNGTVSHQSTFDYNTSRQKSSYDLGLERAKGSDDLSTWRTTAVKKLALLQAEINHYDPTTESNKIDDTKRQADTLLAQIQKYNAYGGFTKPKKASSGRRSTSRRSSGSLTQAQLTKMLAFNPVPYEKTLRSLLKSARVTKVAGV